jgi:hypothetical protein
MGKSLKILRIYALCLVMVAAAFSLAMPVSAQQDEFRLNVNRTFGYSSGSQIRGTFSMSVTGQGTIKAVTFQIDGKAIATIDQAPFSLKWYTTDYSDGWHELSAVVETNDGRKVTTAVRRFQFVSSADETATMQRIVIPTVGGLFLIVLLVIGSQVLLLRKKSKINLPYGAERIYGMSGGTICPKCHRPYAMHWWALNAGITTRYDRCDYCGKWSMVKRASRKELEDAEKAELLMGQPENPMPVKTEEEKLKELMDSARYTDQT